MSDPPFHFDLFKKFKKKKTAATNSRGTDSPNQVLKFTIFMGTYSIGYMDPTNQDQ